MRPIAFVLFAAILPGCGKGAPAEPDPPQPVPATAADYAAVQGKWAIVRVEQAGGVAVGPDSFREFEVTIEGQTVEIAIKGLGSFHAVFVLDAEKAPRHLDFAETDAEGNARSRYLP